MKHLARFALLALLATQGCASAPPAISRNTALAAVGSAAPPFSGTTLDGKPVQLSDFAGKVIVLNFWATWCPPCRAETPDMIKAFGKLASSDVEFLGVDTTETAPVVKSFVAIKGLPYPVALAGPDVYNAFGIAYIPTTIVVDEHGVVRARFTGGVTPDQLAGYVASARAGKNSFYVTPQEKHIDALLALSQFHFSGTPAAVRAQIARAAQRLQQTDDYITLISAGDTLRYDPTKMQHETGELELASANAQMRLAKSKKERLAADASLADASMDLYRYNNAVRFDRSALALSPHDPKFVGALTMAYYRLHDYDTMAKWAAQWVAIAPHDSDAWDQLGLANQRRKNFSAAVPAYQKAVTLLIADARKQPIGTGGPVEAVADESLDFADVYVSLGDAKGAQRLFDQAQHYAALIPDGTPAADMKQRVPERTLEGMTAVALGKGDHTTLALAKWTGANLPGSASSSTYRYRLVTVAPSGKSVTLTTRGLKSGWIASFCQDRLCSPGSVTFTMPSNGMKTYEFQLVPPASNALPGTVAVGAADSNWVTAQ